MRYEHLYPGVSADVHGERGCLEYDLLLKPGADLDQVVVRCDGAKWLSLGADGSLRIDTAAGPLRQTPPVTFQRRDSGPPVRVDSAFRLIDATRFGFSVPNRDLSADLPVDPSLVSLPLKGGTLVPAPLVIVPVLTQADGSFALPWASWPAGIPPATKLCFQVWQPDGAAVQGNAASNGLVATTP